MLIIIGMLVGGVVVGRSLISSAEVKAQISQIGKYNAAVVSFASKFDSLPGDMSATRAAKYGFLVGYACSGNTIGRRDGNGLIDGWPSLILSQTVGETALFWQDLTSPALGQSLIEGQFPNGNAPALNCSYAYNIGNKVIGEYFPIAKIGHGNFVYVYDASSTNWFGIVDINSINNYGGTPNSIPNIPVSQAYSIDAKIDDGIPTTGNVQASYITLSTPPATVLLAAPTTTVSGGNSTSCYDTTTGAYSTNINNGNGANCALSFQMQQ